MVVAVVGVGVREGAAARESRLDQCARHAAAMIVQTNKAAARCDFQASCVSQSTHPEAEKCIQQSCHVQSQRSSTTQSATPLRDSQYHHTPRTDFFDLDNCCTRCGTVHRKKEVKTQPLLPVLGQLSTRSTPFLGLALSMLGRTER